MTLSAVWSEGSLLHDPEGEVWIGVEIEGDETAERGLAMKRAIDALGVEIIEPREYPDEAITAVHDQGMLSYLATAHEEWVKAGYPEDPGQDRVVAYAFRHPGAFAHVTSRLPRSRTAMAGVYCMDTCTVIGPGTYRGVRYAANAALTAADVVLAGTGPAYAAVRPPGHHAGTDYFGGSCYLNNTAIATQHLIGSGLARVGIVDIDAHHGTGTQQIFYERSDVLYTSVHVDPGQGWFPHWCGFEDEQGAGAGIGFNRNFPLPPGCGDEPFIQAVTSAAGMMQDFDCDVLVVSLGVDAGAEDPESPLAVTTGGFARVGELLAGMGTPTVLVQEGGYHIPALERDVTAVLSPFVAD
jgi:acetoin utilization deacetylase AcuC-like enzyme